MRSDAADREQRRITERGQINDRFITANSQLASDKLEERLGGIYALEQIMHDAPTYYGDPIIDILSAYVRRRSWLEVNPDIDRIRTPSADIQAAVTVLGRRPNPNAHWPPNLAQTNLTWADLSGLNLDGAILTEAMLRNANLSRAHLNKANLRDAHLSNVNLRDAHLSGADLTQAQLAGASLIGTNLSGANLSGADLTGADLQGAKMS